ncbi:hypothetical protein GDO86_018319 [Hymenochirus boettgeri]|uniref:Uncharacterized protein n=1 Tax=Hymenochirus boettgeri TaxID=247094 RepID=A0A8T2IDT9_9PIPI|nr:hypothetical protein GDO86_018319 [Hymenochirus boettgeri]
MAKWNKIHRDCPLSWPNGKKVTGIVLFHGQMELKAPGLSLLMAKWNKRLRDLSCPNPIHLWFIFWYQINLKLGNL